MSPLVEAEQISESLRSWLLDQAYPAWWSHGADHVRGGFHERLQQDGLPTGEPRRSRLHPRQIYSFALAQDLAWSGPAVSALSHALKFYLLHYRRADGLFLAVVNADGTVGDASAFLYDQAFALLGLAFACKSLGDKSLRDDARGLLDAIRLHLGHSHGGFDEIPSGTLPLLSNSHMHLFEAALAWFEQDADPRWKHLAEEIVSLATTRFIDRDSGFLLEFFDANWRPVGPHGQRRVEPGHQFEWAWLLLRWSRHSGDLQARQLALQLIDAAENRGVDRSRRVAVNALTSNGAVLDGNARLWPQAERLKAMLLAAETTLDERYLEAAVQSARVLMTYLHAPKAGLWRDTLRPDGTFIEEPAPASSLYHIAGAIVQMMQTLPRLRTAAAISP